MKKVLLTVVSVVLLLILVVLVRTAAFRAEPAGTATALEIAVPQGAAERLAGAIRIPTISYEDAVHFPAQAFTDFHGYLHAQYPRVHATLRREMIGGFSVLYTWQGTDATAEPILLMGHLDVVPVEPGTAEQWTHSPFAGVIAGGFVWGRGAIDDKPSVLGTLEAVEMLIAEGFQPRNTIYLAYGHDEEVGGAGAQATAALLKQRGVRLAMVLDEGGVIGDGMLPGLTRPTALVGVAEKGHVSVGLTAHASGGHSSMPPERTAIGALSAAITRLENNPMPARLDGPALSLFRRIGPELPLLQRAAFANLWLFRPMVLRQLQQGPSSNAMIRSTIAPTIFQAGTKANVLPSRAHAVVNFRVLPGDSTAGVVRHVRRVVNDPALEVRMMDDAWEPSAVSPHDSEAFHAISSTVRQLMPEVLVTPYLVLGATDARHYEALSDNIYRFLPIRLNPADLERMHGTNERIRVEDYHLAIRFYYLLIRRMAGGEGRAG
jgi:carboxypeptidase PM20D1